MPRAGLSRRSRRRRVPTATRSTSPALTDALSICTAKAGKTVPTIIRHPGDPACSVTDYDIAPGFKEFFLGNSPKPRLSVGIGVNWVSPFGPLRLDLAKALLKQE